MRLSTRLLCYLLVLGFFFCYVEAPFDHLTVRYFGLVIKNKI